MMKQILKQSDEKATKYGAKDSLQDSQKMRINPGLDLSIISSDMQILKDIKLAQYLISDLLS